MTQLNANSSKKSSSYIRMISWLPACGQHGPTARLQDGILTSAGGVYRDAQGREVLEDEGREEHTALARELQRDLPRVRGSSPSSQLAASYSAW